MSKLKQIVRRQLQHWRPELIYRQPQSGLQPERLYAYLDTLYKTREVDGAVVEIGCWLGGTSAMGDKLLRRVGSPKRFLCIDTFSGFVDDQFDHDVALGVPTRDRGMFSESSVETVRRLLRTWGCPQIELLQADVVALDEARLPSQISVCLVDVDLELPIYAALTKVWPRLVPGGVTLIDDCPESTSWVGARAGYARFMAEHGLLEEYRLGFGVVTRARREPGRS